MINANDFKSIEVVFKEVMNDTSRTSVKELAKVQISEFATSGMTLEIPAKSCRPQHVICLTVEIKQPGKTNVVKFSATSKVDTMDKLDEEIDLVTVTFVQFEEKEWLEFQNAFSNRQSEINEFIQAVKG